MKKNKTKKISSYQKMKQKYEAQVTQLTADIVTLVEEKDIQKFIEVKQRWQVYLNMEKIIFAGNTDFFGGTESNLIIKSSGFLSRLKNDDIK